MSWIQIFLVFSQKVNKETYEVKGPGGISKSQTKFFKTGGIFNKFFSCIFIAKVDTHNSLITAVKLKQSIEQNSLENIITGDPKKKLYSTTVATKKNSTLLQLLQRKTIEGYLRVTPHFTQHLITQQYKIKLC